VSLTVSPLPTLSPRFGVVSALPTMVLVGWIAFLWGSGALTAAPDMKKVLDALTGASIAQVTLAGLVGVALGSVMHPFQFLLVRLLEGYWADLPGLRRLQYLGMEINRRRMRQLRRAGLTKELNALYPPDEADLLPTRVGNVLRAAERCAGAPYGMDAVVMLPRLYPLASPGVAAVFLDLRNQLDVAARYCVVLALISVSGLAAMATDGLWLILPAVTTLLAWASYRATVRTAVSYGQGLRMLFELHHGQLVQALGWEVPKDLIQLRKLSDALQKWLDEGGTAPADYVGPTASKKATDVTDTSNRPA
jgi:hypothetical protein